MTKLFKLSLLALFLGLMIQPALAPALAHDHEGHNSDTMEEYIPGDEDAGDMDYGDEYMDEEGHDEDRNSR